MKSLMKFGVLTMVIIATSLTSFNAKAVLVDIRPTIGSGCTFLGSLDTASPDIGTTSAVGSIVGALAVTATGISCALIEDALEDWMENESNVDDLMEESEWLDVRPSQSSQWLVKYNGSYYYVNTLLVFDYNSSNNDFDHLAKIGGLYRVVQVWAGGWDYRVDRRYVEIDIEYED